jgi:hypothetical protein
LFEHDSKNIFNGENNVLRKIKSVTHKALLSKKIIDTESTILIVDDCDLKYLAEDIERILYYSKKVNLILHEYYGAAEPPVRCGESHLSGLTEPLRSL